MTLMKVIRLQLLQKLRQGSRFSPENEDENSKSNEISQWWIQLSLFQKLHQGPLIFLRGYRRIRKIQNRLKRWSDRQSPRKELWNKKDQRWRMEKKQTKWKWRWKQYHCSLKMSTFASLTGLPVVVPSIGLIGTLSESLLAIEGDGCFGEGTGPSSSWETKDSISHSRGREGSTLHYHEVIRKGQVWLQYTRGLYGGKWTLKSQSLLDSVLKTWHKQEKGDMVPFAFSRCTILGHPYVVGVREKKTVVLLKLVYALVVFGLDNIQVKSRCSHRSKGDSITS